VRPLSNQAAGRAAFIESQEVVVPLAIRVSTEIRAFVAVSPNNTDIDFLAGPALYSEERCLLGVNPVDGVFPGDTPIPCGVTDVRNVFVGTKPVRLINACDLMFRHLYYLFQL
jgi:hypothetical protein